MEAVFVFEESPAVLARERLVAFVDEVVSGLPLARQRANAGLYVRGLIEQGLFSTLILMGVVTTIITPIMFKKWVQPHLAVSV